MRFSIFSDLNQGYRDTVSSSLYYDAQPLQVYEYDITIHCVRSAVDEYTYLRILSHIRPNERGGGCTSVSSRSTCCRQTTSPLRAEAIVTFLFSTRGRLHANNNNYRQAKYSSSSESAGRWRQHMCALCTTHVRVGLQSVYYTPI